MVAKMPVGASLEWSAEEQEWAALVARVALGDEHALAQLYDCTSRIVYGLALRVLRDPSAAEEIMMEVYLQVWRTAPSYDPARGSASAWLITLARSRAIDYLRSRMARRAATERALDELYELQDPRPDPEQESMELGRARIIREALSQLPPEQRRLLDMTYFSGLSHTEIAGSTGLPLGTVKTRIRSGMMRLRELLGPYVEGL